VQVFTSSAKKGTLPFHYRELIFIIHRLKKYWLWHYSPCNIGKITGPFMLSSLNNQLVPISFPFAEWSMGMGRSEICPTNFIQHSFIILLNSVPNTLLNIEHAGRGSCPSELGSLNKQTNLESWLGGSPARAVPRWPESGRFSLLFSWEDSWIN
jgi:hypothetical protein